MNLEDVINVLNSAQLTLSYDLKNQSYGHNKFWRVSVDRENLTLHYHWGAIGTAGRTMVEGFDDINRLDRKLNQKLREKQRNGYAAVSSPYSHTESVVSIAPAPIAPAPIAPAPVGASPVDDFSYFLQNLV